MTYPNSEFVGVVCFGRLHFFPFFIVNTDFWIRIINEVTYCITFGLVDYGCTLNGSGIIE